MESVPALWILSIYLGETDCETYISSLSVSALLHLDLCLDWDNEGVDKDLDEIAHQMIHWEEDLASPLKLTDVDIHDIKFRNPNSSKLQRFVAVQWT